MMPAGNSLLPAAGKRCAVLYHYPCPDGAFAALAVHLYFSGLQTSAAPPPMFIPNTVYSPLRTEDLPLDQLGSVYLLDFVGPPGFIQQLSPKVGRVVVLDHHKTALEVLGSGIETGGNVTKVIDMERSGATIAFDYFKQKLIGGNLSNDKNGAFEEFQRVRRLFEYIEDADLWRWKLPNSKAFNLGLKDLNIEFDVTSNPLLFEQLLSLDIETVISQGLSSFDRFQRIISEILETSYEIRLGGGAFGHCLAVDVDASVSELKSDIGNQLAAKSLEKNLRGIGAVVYRVPQLQSDEILKVSLRSLGAEDTTAISQKYGGGGHQKASSFLVNDEEFQQWKVCK